MDKPLFDVGDVIEFDYVNYKGEKSHRRALVRGVYESSNEYHRDYQLMVDAFDINKNARRDFAYRYMTNIVNTGIKGKKMSDYFDPDDPFRQPGYPDEVIYNLDSRTFSLKYYDFNE